MSLHADDENTQRPNFNRGERPTRNFTPRETWQGQPYRQEGKPAVPRGLPGERVTCRVLKSKPSYEIGEIEALLRSSAAVAAT
mgnify:CR=1 FL=1